jgi:hypothetical protein
VNGILIPQSRERGKRIGAQVRQTLFELEPDDDRVLPRGEERPSYRSM